MDKAYEVEDPDDDEGRKVLVHAKSREQAKAYALGEYDWEYTSLRAVRAPEFDGVHGDDLIRAQLEAGWWFGCMGPCTGDVRAELMEGGYDEGHRTAPYVLRDGDVYCSAKCCLARLRRDRDSRIALWTAVQAATERWPGIERLQVWHSVSQVNMHFHFPGGEYPAGWTYGEDEVRVTESDAAAWEAFREQKERAA